MRELPWLAPPPTEIPSALPEGWLRGHLAGARRILLFLDYDGTLSEIVPDPKAARPVPGAVDLIRLLAGRPDQLKVVIVSGRDAVQLKDFLGIDRGVYMVVAHGAWLIEPDGRETSLIESDAAAAALAKVREAVQARIPPDSGFVVEDKGIALALHYRNVRPDVAGPVLACFERAVAASEGQLRLGRGKMVVEALPAAASKGYAVALMLKKWPDFTVPIYFGDDVTDEDAFYVLRDREGITVRVGGTEPSWARYRVDDPGSVVRCLAEIAGALEPEQ